MAVGKPVLCSDVTNLPHLASDAARYFDPRDPDDIAAALAFLDDEPEAVANMVVRGRIRAAELGTARDTASRSSRSSTRSSLGTPARDRSTSNLRHYAVSEPGAVH